MSKHATRFLPVMLILGVVLSSCNLPINVVIGSEPELSEDEVVGTAVAKALAEQALAAAPSATPAPQGAAPAAEGAAPQCNASITTTTDANVRAGPSTEYAIVGNIPAGGTAPIAGTNEAHTWWYIVFAGGPGGYGWIAGSIVNASCLPTVVNIVSAPPPPPPPAPDEPSPTPTQKGWIGPLLDLPLFLLPSPTPTPLVFDLPNFDLDYGFPWDQ